MIDHIANGAHRHAMTDRLSQINHENGHALGFFRDLCHGRRARQQNHEVGMLYAGDPHLLTIDHITIALADCSGLDFSGVGSGGWFSHAHGLQS